MIILIIVGSPDFFEKDRTSFGRLEPTERGLFGPQKPPEKWNFPDKIPLNRTWSEFQDIPKSRPVAAPFLTSDMGCLFACLHET
jgi:hypothetical protein